MNQILKGVFNKGVGVACVEAGQEKCTYVSVDISNTVKV